MKKLTRKLFLSVCTLAICAVTLVSTTFAWYTTNSEVSASAVTGTSSDASTDDSILIATSIDKTVNNWSEFSNSVTITENSYLKVGTDLEPLTFNSKGALDNQANALSNTESAAHTNASGAYILIPLKFKTGANDSNAVNIYLKSLSITNTAEEALAKFDGIVEAGGVEKGVQYSIDVCYAINMIVAEDQNPSPDNKVYDLGTQVTENATADPTIDGSSTKYGTGGAVEYYNAVMGLDGTTGKEKIVPETDTRYAFDSTGNATQVGTIADPSQDQYVIVYFYFYLDGWDLDCYDACRGQSFSISLEFTTDETKALKSTQRS